MKKFLIILLFVSHASITPAQIANTLLSNLATPTAVNQSLLPNGNSTLNLGTYPNQWSNLYLGNYIFFGGFKSISINTSNVSIGGLSLLNNSSGTANTTVGNLSMYSNTTGLANSACGAYALY